MTVFKAAILFALIYISFSEQLGVRTNESVVDYLVMVPQQVLDELTDISDSSKGLLTMWKKSKNLTNETLLKDEVSMCIARADGGIASEIFLLQYKNMKYKVCKELIFRDAPKCHKATTSLKRSQLVDYYNELVIQLRIAENFINTSISREIQESKRAQVEEAQRKVIKLLRENILPLITVVVSSFVRKCSPSLYNYINVVLWHGLIVV